MREILFRAWDKVSKKYREFDGMHDTMTINEDGKVEYYNLQNGSGGDEYILEQFTGLVDRNGKRIFDGDILLTNGMDGKLLWVSYFDDEEAQFDFCPLGHEYISTHNELYYSSKRQIIGNIHDNPEFLEAK